ncbi:MAG: dipeptide epimerase [Candidatus Aminicenantes bacterium]|nr:dipeptide epimerase [Candidatus Aminicenantes bacterium]
MTMSRKNFLKALGLGFLSTGAGKGLAQPSASLEKAKAEASKLKITGVDIYAFDIPLKEPFKISIGTVTAANDVLVMLRTDAGIVGVGEACPFHPITGETQEMNLAAAKGLREIVLGKSPLAVESLVHSFGPFLHSNPSAAAAFDTALYDILGKIAGLPLYRLFGGDKPSFGTDITTDLDEPQKMAAKAKEYIDRGFDTIKIKVGQGQAADLARLEAIRQAIGYERKIRIDANQGWMPPLAIDTLKKMEKYQVEFVEQPVLATDVAGLKAVHAASPIPVMADEALFYPSDAVKLIKEEACSYFNIKLMKAGGILNMIKIAHVADAANMLCMVGCMVDSRLGLTAAAHVVASNRNIVFADLDGHSSHTIDPIVGGMLFEKGQITVPDLPGVGADVDPVFLKKLQKI